MVWHCYYLTAATSLYHEFSSLLPTAANSSTKPCNPAASSPSTQHPPTNATRKNTRVNQIGGRTRGERCYQRDSNKLSSRQLPQAPPTSGYSVHQFAMKVALTRSGRPSNTPCPKLPAKSTALPALGMVSTAAVGLSGTAAWLVGSNVCCNTIVGPALGLR